MAKISKEFASWLVSFKEERKRRRLWNESWDMKRRYKTVEKEKKKRV